MLTSEIIKTEDFLHLQRQAQEGLLSKAILLIGKDDVYTDEFASAIAALIFDRKIDQASENYKKVMARSHPDLKVYPQKDKLLVGDSEEIVEESFIKPIFADSKIFKILNIDNSTESAQNKLLKVVEEPSKHVYMILTCKNIELVLPTIRSRCNKIELGKLSPDVVKDLLPKVEDEKKALALAVSDGMIGKAIKLASMKNFTELCEDTLALFTKMKTSRQVLTHSKKLLSYKDQLSLEIEIMQLIIEDLMKIKAGKNDLVKLPYISELKAVSDEYTLRALCQITYLLDNVTKETGYNVSPTLSFENLLLNILEVKYICK